MGRKREAKSIQLKRDMLIADGKVRITNISKYNYTEEFGFTPKGFYWFSYIVKVLGNPFSSRKDLARNTKELREKLENQWNTKTSKEIIKNFRKEES